MTSGDLLRTLNLYIKERVESDVNIDEIIDTLNKVSEINSVYANYLRGKLDPMRRSVFLEQLNKWVDGGETSREFSGLFRGK
jgi:hypothetical protein